MTKLTPLAKRVYSGLLLGNAILLGVAVTLFVSFFSLSKQPVIPQNMMREIPLFVHHLKSEPENHWPALLNKQHFHRLELSLSNTPKYPNNALLTLPVSTLMNGIKQQKSLHVSVFIKKDKWLNMTLATAMPHRTRVMVVFFILGMGVLIAFVCLNFWAVNRLNQSIQSLIQHLHYAKKQLFWSPIPLVGDEEQQGILKHINALQEKTNQLLHNRTHMLAAISHDLRTPLTRLKLRAEYLASNPHFEKMMHDIVDMETMINETLGYFADVNREEKRQRFDLVALLHSICEDARDAKGSVDFTHDTARVVYTGCINLLKRAFCNVINNAMNHGNHVTVHVEVLSQQIMVIVQDDGPGLQPHEFKRVFEPFYRGEHSRSRETGGTGLGLTIAKEILQWHHGTIDLDNGENGGLRVIIRLMR